MHVCLCGISMIHEQRWARVVMQCTRIILARTFLIIARSCPPTSAIIAIIARTTLLLHMMHACPLRIHMMHDAHLRSIARRVVCLKGVTRVCTRGE